MLLGLATSYPVILVAAGAVGIGSAIFHPEASCVACIAPGGRFGIAQNLFQASRAPTSGPELAPDSYKINQHTEIDRFG